MQLQFHKSQLPCLQQVHREILTQEQTQELRIVEDMPDIGTTLSAWGQVLIRGKEWRHDSMVLSCGVMVWAMYQPEDGSEPQMVEGWLPFQFQWELPETDTDGTMLVSCLLRSVDARVTSARKLMLRATLEVLGEAWAPMETELYFPEEVPEDVRLLKRMYPVVLPKEAGEKAFAIDEELTLPASAPKLRKLLRFSLQPEITDQKVMGEKVVFRGAALLHILYGADDGSLCTWDFELPFSQYGELDQAYDQASAVLLPAITALELESDPEGRLHLKAGLTGQYRIHDRCQIEVVEDAYSPNRHVHRETEELKLPVILEEQSQTVSSQQTIPEEFARVVDLAFYPHQMRMSRKEEQVEGELSGQFQVLAYDRNGILQGTAPKWHENWNLPAHPNSQVDLTVNPSGIPQTIPGAETTLRGDMLLHVQTMDTQGIPMVKALELGEQKEPDPMRPSLILRKAGKDSLWDLAKAAGSTVEAIQEVNGLQGEPPEDRMLLIPVP